MEVLEDWFEVNSLVEEALVSGGVVVKLLKVEILVFYCLWNLIDCFIDFFGDVWIFWWNPRRVLLIFVVMCEYFVETLEG